MSSFRMIFLALVVLFFVGFFDANAYVASSTNYRIDSDTVSAGGALATSTNYSLQSTLSTMSSETSTSSSFSIYSGYLQMATPYLAVSAPGNVVMAPAISISGGRGDGSAVWAVTTDSSGGYSLAIKASTDPALKSTLDSFSNYSTTVGGVPNFEWGIGSSGQAFGFTPEGADIKSTYKDDGVSLCNTGSSDTSDKCWDSLLTSNKTIAQRNSSNHPAGSSTTVKFRAEAGSLVTKQIGSYSATITVTVLAL